MTSVNYPTTYSFVFPSLVATPGPTYTYAFDSMSRPIGLTDQTNYAAVSGVQYGGANQPPDMLTSMSYFGVTETRQYNTLRQLTNLTVPGQLNMTYTFPAGANNGKISSQTDALSGETVTYAYDSLNRLLSASGTGWNQSFGYDGFGNLVSKSGLNSPPLSLAVDPATNRAILTNVQYDANGNPNAYNGTPLLYDSENHVLSAVGLTDYLYDSQGKRIWKGSFSGGSLVGQEVYFYGVDGQKLGTYTLYLNYGTGQPLYLADPNASLAVFFGGKRVAVNGAPFVPDRLGSNTAGKYFPYGEDRGTPAANDQVKFGTYTRDSASGLDYADQRYYSSQYGRFMTPDPYSAISNSPYDPKTPLSWNRYSYVQGDPINFNDPNGRDLNLVGTIIDILKNLGLIRADSVSVSAPFDPVYFFPFTLPSFAIPGSEGARGKEGDSDVPDTRAEQQAWQDCYKNVKQQQNAAAENMLQWVESIYPTWLAMGAWWGGAAGFFTAVLTGPMSPLDTFIFTYLGAHIGLVGANEWHTDAILLLNIIANLPPRDSVVAANCGPRPGH